MLKDMLKRIKDTLKRRRIYVVFMLALLFIAATLMLHFLRKDEPALPKEPESRAEQPSQTVSPPTPSPELPPRKEPEPRAEQPSQTVSPPTPSPELPPRKEPEPRAEQPSQTVSTRIEGIAPTKKTTTRAEQPSQTVSTRIEGIAPTKKTTTRAEQPSQTVSTRIEGIAPTKKTTTRAEQPSQTVSKPITELHPPKRMVLIPAGEFQMGSTYLTNKESQPVHTVYLDAFYIDTHEVTVGEYKQFLKTQGKQRLSSVAEKYVPTDKHPIVDVSWHDAMAYAQWAGKRLPTEAEWEKAARGPEQFEHYPWEGEDIGSSQANYNGTWGEILPVGRFKPNGYGLYDIAGNVFEWCLDPFFNDFYKNSPKKNPFAGFQFKTRDETIAASKSVKGQRVIRGGTWKSEPLNVRVDVRNKAGGTQGYINVGFRCARDVQ